MLETLVPRVLQGNTTFRCIPFEGKQDLEKQLMRKIRAYQQQRARFIVLRDQDSHPDCRQIKDNLLRLCRETGKADKCRVRIACRELEAFYLADLQAVEQALGLRNISVRQASSRYRSPDQLQNPAADLKTLTRKCYRKVSGSRLIGSHLDPDNGRSPSFRNLIAAIRSTEMELLEKAEPGIP